ncbi:MAG: hypothetical protein GXO08_04435 [Aquificae bacterium]|nr:hypothetical protein [Aquificota bacterium]
MLSPKQLEELRDEFRKIVRENNLDGLILADIEGLPLVSYIQQEEASEDTLAAAGAAIFTAGLMTVSDAGKRGLDQVVLHSPDGYIIYTQVTDDLVLGVLSPADAKLGILRMLIKSLQEKIQKMA